MRQPLLALLKAAVNPAVSASLQSPAALQVLLLMHSASAAAAPPLSTAGEVACAAIAAAIGIEADAPEACLWLDMLTHRSSSSTEYDTYKSSVNLCSIDVTGSCASRLHFHWILCAVGSDLDDVTFPPFLGSGLENVLSSLLGVTAQLVLVNYGILL